MRAKLRQYIMMAMIAAMGAMTLGITPVQASLYNLYQEIGEKWVSISERAPTAAEFGIWGYEGSAEQNIELEKRMAEAYGLEQKDDDILGFSVISRYKTTLSSSMTATQTTIPVASMSTFDNTTITFALLGGTKVFLTLEPGSSKEEIIKCTGISGTSWTGCTRGLAFSGTSESGVQANQKTHNAGSTVVMSNTHYVYENFVDAVDAETIGGIKTFTLRPLISSAGGVASTTQQIVTYGELQTMANQGAATSTETLGGISVLATKLEMASSTPFGVTNPHVIQSQFATTTPYKHTNLGNFVVVTKNDGYIDQEMLNAAYNFAWTGNNTHSGTNTFTATTTLGVTTTLATGGFMRGQVSYSMIAGENISRGDALVIGDNGVYRSSASLASTTVDFIGFAKNGVSSGESVDVISTGVIDGFTGLSTASNTRQYFLSNTSGVIQTSTGTVENFVGIAISSTQLLIQKSTKPQFLSSATGSTIPVPQKAKMAIFSLVGSAGGPLDITCQVTLYKYGRESQSCYIGIGTNNITVSVAWNGNNITSSQSSSGGATTITVTAHFYY